MRGLFLFSPVSKHLLEICDLIDIQRKMELYKSMFYCNTGSDRDTNYIKSESLRIELIAGGLNWKQQEFIMERLQPNLFMEVCVIYTRKTYALLHKNSIIYFFFQKRVILYTRICEDEIENTLSVP